MKKDIKKAWVAALRSGEYLKGTGQLRAPGNRFCCLGVLCNLHAQAHPEIAAEQEECGRYLGAKSHLPPEVQEWAGLQNISPEVQNASGFGPNKASLASINDSGASFSEIADLIENQL